MYHGFIKTAAASPQISVADCAGNVTRILEAIKQMDAQKSKLMIFPELCITGYTCADLFWQGTLLEEAKRQLQVLAKKTMDVDGLVFVGLPWEHCGKLYDAAAVLNRGSVLAVIPKTYIPSGAPSNETRYFASAQDAVGVTTFAGIEIPFGVNIIFQCEEMPNFKVACEINHDIYAPTSPGSRHVRNGALIVANLAADPESVGRAGRRRDLVRETSARNICGYVYAAAGDGESSTDLVFSGHSIISEYGSILSEAKRFENDIIYADIDVDFLSDERRKCVTEKTDEFHGHYVTCPFSVWVGDTKLTRHFSPTPFVPENTDIRKERCSEVLTIQAAGLKIRLRHIGCKKVIIGLSGGLDSTLAILVAARAFDMLNLPRKDIIAVTMPCFGTTDRTYDNACKLAGALGATLREIDIKQSVTLHFKDIGHDIAVTNAAYENAQARERTQVLMDMANDLGAIVIGTGDLSEIALGWATYNGDHMSMYGVNADVPKTLIRHVVAHYADTCGDEALALILRDVLDTPVSPELLPSKEGDMTQKTEELVGPYELHDFFLYYMVRRSYSPDKIARLAQHAFGKEYTKAEIQKWLKKFYQRFFSQQYKRSASPDGPGVGSVTLSPRGGWQMPSDAHADAWLKEI